MRPSKSDLMMDQFCQSYPIAGSSVLMSSLKVTTTALLLPWPRTAGGRSRDRTTNAQTTHRTVLPSPPLPEPPPPRDPPAHEGPEDQPDHGHDGQGGVP